jgi:hypothetical protein
LRFKLKDQGYKVGRAKPSNKMAIAVMDEKIDAAVKSFEVRHNLTYKFLLGHMLDPTFP